MSYFDEMDYSETSLDASRYPASPHYPSSPYDTRDTEAEPDYYQPAEEEQDSHLSESGYYDGYGYYPPPPMGMRREDAAGYSSASYRPSGSYAFFGSSSSGYGHHGHGHKCCKKKNNFFRNIAMAIGAVILFNDFFERLLNRDLNGNGDIGTRRKKRGITAQGVILGDLFSVEGKCSDCSLLNRGLEELV